MTALISSLGEAWWVGGRVWGACCISAVAAADLVSVIDRLVICLVAWRETMLLLAK